MLDENIYFINPYDSLCGEKVCQVLTPDGYPIYSDPTHLRRWGSIYFINLIRENLMLKIAF